MILHVANLGHPVLRRRAEPISEEELKSPRFQAFLDDLVESMRFHDGVGLAAPQVFQSVRAVAVWVPPEMDEEGGGLEAAAYVNPEISLLGDEQELGLEGCLSLKDLRGLVPRHRRIQLRALDRHARPLELKLAGFPARVFQHELDHLDGIVFTDRMEDMSTLVFAAELERYGIPGMEDEEPA
ncbi:MAG: peptide deformylase [Deltaproteobacteria bacterium]|nr:peptide deformylase [Deltaproteobacteria bacterium]